jgi:superfamily II DNA or RNA helicase
MADSWAEADGQWPDRIVISTVQTQIAGQNGGRMTRFRPADFATVIVDEAHHAPARTYKRILEHYTQNPDCRVLGVTATPDRLDEKALGQIFDTVAYDYEIPDAIADGWLVPIQARAVEVDGLDLSHVRTTAGDLNGADMARVLEEEQVLHEMAQPIVELSAGKRTLVFVATVVQAERMAEVLNRHDHGIAQWVCGKTPKVERRALLRDYRGRDGQANEVPCPVRSDGRERHEEPAWRPRRAGRGPGQGRGHRDVSEAESGDR